MSHLDCPCGSQLKVGAAHVNRPLRCPACHRVLRLVAAPDALLATPLAALVVEAGPAMAGMCLYLAGDKPIAFGKDEAVTLRLPAQAVSHKHGTLEPAGAAWRVIDAQSKNGVIVNGKRIVAHLLGQGDALQVGEYRLRYLPTGQLRANAGKIPIPAAPRAPANPPPGGKAPVRPASPNLTFVDAPATPGETAAAATPPAHTGDELHFAPDEGDIFPTAAPPAPRKTGPQTCPKCKDTLPSEARICVKCGIDLGTGRSLMEGRDAVIASPSGDAARRGPQKRSRTSEPAMTAAAQTGSIAAYLRDCFRAFAFPLAPMDLLKLFMLVTVVVIADYVPAGLFLIVGWALLYGMYVAFLFNVVCNAANGERDLPEITGPDGMSGFWDGAIAPVIKFGFVSLIAFAPAFIYRIVTDMGTGAAATLHDPVALALTAFGILAWPMVMLVVAIGGLGSLARPDLMVVTIARTIGPYIVVCVLTAVATSATGYAEAGAAALSAKLKVNAMAVAAALRILNVYMSIIAMQAIGLYYHHFKSRFAWNWG